LLINQVDGKIRRMTHITRREFVAAALAGAATVPKLTMSQTRPRPNILFILADDLGYGDLSCYGRPDYQTPNLDLLAAQGVRLLNAYSASPVCTPTRCALITGRYPARTRVGLEEPLTERGELGDKAMTLGLPPGHPTIASLLKQNGYETALIGKWHLGYLPNFGPIQSGFEEFFGIMSGAVDFFTHKDTRGDLDFFEGKVPVERIGYMTDMLTRRAVEYISERGRSQRRARPFYLSLHYTAPHWPLHAHDEDIAKYKGRFDAGWDELREARLARLVERPIFRLRLPNAVAPMVAALDSWFGSKKHKWPYLTRSQVRLLSGYFYFSSARASRELGYQPRSARASLADAYAFWLDNRRRRAA